MGSSPSKSDSSASHVFSANTPVRFSETLVNSLQDNPETDATRARNMERIIEARVTSELQKRLEKSTHRYSAAAENLSAEPYTPSKSSDTSHFNPDLDSTEVSKEVEELRRKLNARRKLVQSDQEVERAKESVIICLRQNDRRPLDCWREVEKFKAEVSRLERALIDKNS